MYFNYVSLMGNNKNNLIDYLLYHSLRIIFSSGFNFNKDEIYLIYFHFFINYRLLFKSVDLIY